MEKRKNMKQIGCIVFGAGMNTRTWIEAAKKEGFVVLICAGCAELWR